MSVYTSNSIISHSAVQTVQFGARFGRLLVGGDVICLSGMLGAGKTAFASGIGQGWGARETINSPTFVFVHEHHRADDDLRLYHVDCYRLTSLDDAESIGIEDILAGDAGEGIAVIEWAERIAPLLPADHLWITLEMPSETADTERQIMFEATGRRGLALLETFFCDVDLL